ncbi:MAG: choice-of-anchor B family protein [bacterium]
MNGSRSALLAFGLAGTALPALAVPQHAVTRPIPGDNVILDSCLNEHPSYSDIWGYTAPDGREYALLGTYTGTAVIDITDRRRPREVSFVTGPSSIWREIKTWGSWAYVVSEGGGGLQMVNLADPAHPVTSSWMGFTTAHNLWVDEQSATAYIAGRERSGGVLILRMLGPSAPSPLGAWDVAYAHDVYSRDGILYLSAIYQGRLYLLDVADPAHPSQMGFVGNYPNAFTHNAWPTADGHHVLTTDERSGAYVHCWDVTNPAAPSLSSFYGPVDGARSIPHNVFVDGNLAYVSWYTMGVIVLDVSDPEAIHEVARYDTHPEGNNGTFEGCWGVFPFYPNSPGLFVASDIERGLYVLELESDLVSGVARSRRAAAGARAAAGEGAAASGRMDGPASTSAAARLRVAAPFPNPADRSGVTLALHASAPARVAAEVLDAAGRRVRSLPERAVSAGDSFLAWDGRDRAGRRVAPGAYFVRVIAGAEETVRKVVVTR